MEIKLEDFDLFSLSRIDYKIKIGWSSATNAAKIVVVEFKGLYKEGAAGEKDSRFMMTIAEAAWTTTQPDAGLLDLRNLAYSWGDNLDWIANFSPSGNRPTAVVVGDRNKKAILSLFVAQSIDQLDNFFETFEQAWQYLERKIEDKGK